MGRKPTKPQAQRFTFAGYDQRQFKRSDQYAAAIDQLYNAAIADFAKLANQATVDPDQCFSFSEKPTLQKKAQDIVNTLASKMTAVIQHGSRDSWLYACQKNDAFLNHIMDTAKIGKRQLKRMQDRNLTALDAFQTRKTNGMDLSQRVWKYAGETKDLIELGIDIAVGDGTPAAKMATTLKQHLVEPNKLFRRVRDKHGNLVLSKRAAAYHPGQGVYRSSYQNALRLARTEVNMAYRDSDRYRWAQLDFVVGYEVHLSNNHTCKGLKKGAKYKDICDDLAGKYPKEFVFKGWHPNCRCFMTPILKDPKEFKTDQENALRDAFWGDDDFDGEGNYRKYTDSSVNQVVDVPAGFKSWAKANVERAKGWSKQPYFIRDNFVGGTLEGDLKLVKPSIPAPVKTEETINEDQKQIQAQQGVIADLMAKANEWGFTTAKLNQAIKAGKYADVMMEIGNLKGRIDDAEKELADYLAEATDAVVNAGKKKIDASSVSNDINSAKLDKRDWIMGKSYMKKRLSDLKFEIENADSVFKDNVNALKGKSVEYREVNTFDEQPTEQTIIDRLGGGDLTAGSCSSLALAFAANKQGMDVLDFRDGDSRKHFASHANINNVIAQAGGVNTFASGVQMMRTAEEGKLYYLAISCHAAIVRRTGKANFEYLELQSATDNGWHKLDATVFGWRFGAKGTNCYAHMCEIGQLAGSAGYKTMMGYINTAEDKQRKGASGFAK